MSNDDKYELVGESPQMRDVRRRIDMVSKSSTNVLIVGETGTGKELVARQIHTKSRYSEGPFVDVNCGAIPREIVESELFGSERGGFTGAHDRPGAFELANGGTLFLDELGAMPPETQPKFLRAVEYKRFRRVGGREEIKVNVRVLSATNNTNIYNDPNFRKDLYYRLGRYIIRIVPLRERPEDIIPIAILYIEMLNRENNYRVALDNLTHPLLMEYNWPGNVRDLQVVLERACIDSTNSVLTHDIIAEKIMERKEEAGKISPNVPETQRLSYIVADELYRNIVDERASFWDVVRVPYNNHYIDKSVLRALVDIGLKKTKGNYKLLARMFNIAPDNRTEYNGFLSFLRRNDAHLNFRSYRK